MGVTTLPLDFAIFLRSGSRIQPDSATSDHGTQSNSALLRTIVENSQVRMMSCACGRRSIGNTRANRSGSRTQPPTICGVSEDVAHVSMTSGSPVKPPGTSRCAGPKPGAGSDDGSTGSADSSGSSGGSSYRGLPASSSRYQTGNGTPKKR